MAHELKLRKGNKSLIISSGRYGLGSDFVPPSTSWALNMSGSTSANRLGGSSVISRRAVNSDMGFTVYVNGSSKSEIDKGVRDLAAMIDMAGDPNEPLYLEWRANSDLPIPIWGQFGAPLRAEVVSGRISRDGLYGLAGRRGDTGRIGVELVIKPYWLGALQYTLQAEGCVLEDRWPWYTDNCSRGLVVGMAVTNLMTNPVFGYSGDPLNGWDDTTSVNETSFNPEYILFDHASCRTTSPSGTGRSHQTINVGDTNTYVLSCYAKLQDGGVISATQCALYYGAAKATTYTAVGNGWYRLNADVTGIASDTETGIQVSSGYEVYTDGWQLQLGAGTPTPLAWGDLPGCAWSGAVHASTTTRTASKILLKFKGVTNQSYISGYSLAEFSVSVTWKTSVASTHSTDMYLFDNLAIEAYYKASDDKFYFTDGTTTISSAAQTFAAGDTIHLVFVAKPGEMRIYKNGVSIANGNAYDPEQGVMYIGSKIDATSPLWGVIQGFTIYDRGLTQAQVTSIYNDITPLIADGDIIDYMPFAISTAVSDATANQYEDASNKDYLVIGGIPGTGPAESVIENTLIDGAYYGLTLNLHAVDNPQRMLNTFKDENGQALASTLSTEVNRSAAFTTTPTDILTGISINQPAYNYQGKPLYAALKLADNGTGLAARIEAGNADGEWQELAADTTVRYFIVGPITMPDILPGKFSGWYPTSLTVNVYCKRTGSSATVDVDYVRLMFGSVCYVPTVGSYATIMVSGKNAYSGTDEEIYQSSLVRGDSIEFEPNKFNYLVVINATIGAAQTYTVDSQTRIWVTPRWSIV